MGNTLSPGDWGSFLVCASVVSGVGIALGCVSIVYGPAHSILQAEEAGTFL